MLTRRVLGRYLPFQVAVPALLTQGAGRGIGEGAFTISRRNSVLTLSDHQITLVQDSWRKVVPIGSLAAEMFYAKLFAMDPKLRALFKDDLKKQQAKLIAMLTIAVQALGRADTLVPALRDLGRRHAYYGVQPAHYDTVEVALLWTLEHTLGDAYTRDVKQSWTTVLALVSSTMKDAARPSRTARQC